MRYLLFFLGLLLFSCHKKEAPLSEETGQIQLDFSHRVGDSPLVLDTFAYTNGAGNTYQITGLHYFISDVILYKNGQETYPIQAWVDKWYVNIALSSTLSWAVLDEFPIGHYDSISFVFGIPTPSNISFMYVNPPEVNMAWPDVLGGGYHYMMLDGKWLNSTNQPQGFNFHLGIGQLYQGNTMSIDSIMGYVDNSFRVTLPTPTLMVEANKTSPCRLVMDISSWFETPHIWDFNLWGGAIMQNQAAMQTAKENGFDVFTFDGTK